MKFMVTGTMTVSCAIEVEAESKKEAIEIAESANVAGLCHSCSSQSHHEGEWIIDNDGTPEINEEDVEEL